MQLSVITIIDVVMIALIDGFSGPGEVLPFVLTGSAEGLSRASSGRGLVLERRGVPAADRRMMREGRRCGSSATRLV